MPSPVRRDLLRGALALPFLVRSAVAQPAPDWPGRPMRWIVPYAPGGAVDTVARAIGARVGEMLGQSVVIENRTGGNSLIAANAVLTSPRDGYTFLIDAANHITNPLLMRELPFDYRAAFTPVTQINAFPQVLAVRQDFPASTVAEFIAYAKAHPATVSYGTPPTGGMAHLAGEQFQREAGIRLVHTPYRGGADAARDITAGVLDAVIITTSSIRAPVQAGRARILAVTSAGRAVAYPEVPTLAESGMPGFEMDDWSGLFAATGISPPIITKLQSAIAEAARDPAVLARLDPAGAVLVASTPDVFARWLDGQRSVLQRVITGAGVSLN
jgi:tripartite-type tricarboxylate transporter receptor subunit TctC